MSGSVKVVWKASLRRRLWMWLRGYRTTDYGTYRRWEKK